MKTKGVRGADRPSPPHPPTWRISKQFKAWFILVFILLSFDFVGSEHRKLKIPTYYFPRHPTPKTSHSWSIAEYTWNNAVIMLSPFIFIILTKYFLSVTYKKIFIFPHNEYYRGLISSNPRGDGFGAWGNCPAAWHPLSEWKIYSGPYTLSKSIFF